MFRLLFWFLIKIDTVLFQLYLHTHCECESITRQDSGLRPSLSGLFAEVLDNWLVSSFSLILRPIFTLGSISTVLLQKTGIFKHKKNVCLCSTSYFSPKCVAHMSHRWLTIPCTRLAHLRNPDFFFLPSHQSLREDRMLVLLRWPVCNPMHPKSSRQASYHWIVTGTFRLV